MKNHLLSVNYLYQLVVCTFVLLIVLFYLKQSQIVTPIISAAMKPPIAPPTRPVIA